MQPGLKDDCWRLSSLRRIQNGNPGSHETGGTSMPRNVGGVNARRITPIGAAGRPAFGDVAYNGGALISCPRIHAAFWGPLWSDRTHLLQAQRLVQFLRDLVASDWMNVLSQYGGGTGNGSGTFVSESFVSNVSGTLSDNDIHRTLQSEINGGKIPEPPPRNTSEVVMIFLDESLAVKDSNTAVMCEPSGDNAFGYHFGFTTAAGNNYYYGVIPALNDVCVINSCPCQNQIAGNTTSATPFITADGWVYFRGTDDKLWKVKNDGTGQLDRKST